MSTDDEDGDYRAIPPEFWGYFNRPGGVKFKNPQGHTITRYPDGSITAENWDTGYFAVRVPQPGGSFKEDHYSGIEFRREDIDLLVATLEAEKATKQ